MTTKTDELTFVGIPAYSVAVDEEYLSEGQKKNIWKKFYYCGKSN
jgi:hypothetical protein